MYKSISLFVYLNGNLYDIYCDTSFFLHINPIDTAASQLLNFYDTRDT